MRTLFYLLSLVLCVQTVLHCGGDSPKRKRNDDSSESASSQKKKRYSQEELIHIMSLMQKYREQRLKIQSLIKDLQKGTEEIEQNIASLYKEREQVESADSFNRSVESDEESDASTVGRSSPLLADFDAMEEIAQEKRTMPELWLFRYDARSKQGFACYEGKSIRVWDLSSRRSIATIAVPDEGDILDLRIHPYKPQHCIIATKDSIQVLGPAGCLWKSKVDVGKDTRVLYINPHNQRQLFTGHGNGIVRLWDIETGKRLKEFTMFDTSRENSNENAIFSLCTTQDKTLIAATYKGKVKLKTEVSSIPFQSFPADEESLLYTHPIDSGKIIVAGNGIRIRSIRGKNWPQAFKTADDVTAVCTIHNSSMYIIAGLKNGSIELWRELDAHNYALITTFSKCHTGPIIFLGFDEEKNQLISAGEDGLIKVWDLNKERTYAHCVDSLI